MFFLVPDSKTYIPGARKCIYCPSGDATTPELSREHIIAKNLGGKLILHNAACSECAAIINREIENPCLKTMWLEARTHLGLPTRNPRRTLRLGSWDRAAGGIPKSMSDANFRFEQIPIEKHPFLLTMPILPPPGILQGLPLADTDKVHVRFWLRRPDRSYPQLESERHIGAMQPFNLAPLFRMVAKIAHGAATAELGENAFSPLLPDIIMGRGTHFNHLVGTLPKKGRRRLALHRITLEMEKGFVVANVQLFARLGAPVFQAVVGRPNFSVFRDRESKFVAGAAATISNQSHGLRRVRQELR